MEIIQSTEFKVQGTVIGQPAEKIMTKFKLEGKESTELRDLLRVRGLHHSQERSWND